MPSRDSKGFPRQWKVQRNEGSESEVRGAASLTSLSDDVVPTITKERLASHVLCIGSRSRHAQFGVKLESSLVIA